MSYSIQGYLSLLTSGFTSEIDIPQQYLQIPDLLYAIRSHNWTIIPSPMPGWVKARRFYSSN